jgi:hypothetical protein
LLPRHEEKGENSQGSYLPAIDHFKKYFSQKNIFYAQGENRGEEMRVFFFNPTNVCLSRGVNI